MAIGKSSGRECQPCICNLRAGVRVIRLSSTHGGTMPWHSPWAKSWLRSLMSLLYLASDLAVAIGIHLTAAKSVNMLIESYVAISSSDLVQVQSVATHLFCPSAPPSIHV